MLNVTDLMITNRFEEGRTDLDELIAPLAELAQDSPWLIVGYVPTASRRREDAIPYFHVCGSTAERPPVRALLVGGWHGQETRAACSIARIVAAMEQRSALAAGLEITAFPVANLAAYRAGTKSRAGQIAAAPRCWQSSELEFVRVIEKELHRYPYDIAISLQESPDVSAIQIEAWLDEDSHRVVIGESLQASAGQATGLEWSSNPPSPRHPRLFTPVPGVEKQPSEIVITLPPASHGSNPMNDLAGVVFSVLHSLRQARQEGVL